MVKADATTVRNGLKRHSPTAMWVQMGQRGWWAPCIWCALGIAALADDDVVIHSRIGGEAEDLDLHVSQGLGTKENAALKVSDTFGQQRRIAESRRPFDAAAT